MVIEFSRLEALFELRFWLQVMGDHLRIIQRSMAPEEVARIQRAASLTRRFDDLLEGVRQQPMSDQELGAALEESRRAGEELRGFQLEILGETLVGKVATDMSPGFYSHATDELDEFMRLLSYYAQGKAPPAVHPLHQDLLWLWDASVHADIDRARLDPLEEKLSERLGHFAKELAAFYLNAIDLDKFLRAGVFEFPALARFHREVEPEMLAFRELLRELRDLEIEQRSARLPGSSAGRPPVPGGVLLPDQALANGTGEASRLRSHRALRRPVGERMEPCGAGVRFGARELPGDGAGGDEPG